MLVHYHTTCLIDQSDHYRLLLDCIVEKYLLKLQARAKEGIFDNNVRRLVFKTIFITS